MVVIAGEDPGSVDEGYAAIMLVGRLTGHTQAASRVVQGMQVRIALLVHGALVALGALEAVLTSDCLAHVHGVAVVVARHPLSGTPLVAPMCTGYREGRQAGDMPPYRAG